MGRNYVYVYNSKKNEFKRYSVSLKQWSSLPPPPAGSLVGGIAGYLTYHATTDDKDVLLYLRGSQYDLSTYYPPEYPDGSLRNKWKKTHEPSRDESGERGAASDGQYVYYMGNGREETYA